jgi:hypothetical protein
MTKETAIKLFESKQVRSVWDAEKGKWHFAIIDVVSMLTASSDPGAYWRKLKERLKKEGNETVTNCHGLKMTAADGKQRLTDVADAEQLLRLIQYPGNEFPVYAPCVPTGRATLAVPWGRRDNKRGIYSPACCHIPEFCDNEVIKHGQHLYILELSYRFQYQE